MTIGEYEIDESPVRLKFTYGEALAVGDSVELTDDFTVKKPAAADSVKVVGHITDAGALNDEKAISTRFRAVVKRTSGAAVAVGPVVLNAANKVIAYAGFATDDPFAVIGFALEAATAADEEITVGLI